MPHLPEFLLSQMSWFWLFHASFCQARATEIEPQAVALDRPAERPRRVVVADERVASIEDLVGSPAVVRLPNHEPVRV